MTANKADALIGALILLIAALALADIVVRLI